MTGYQPIQVPIATNERWLALTRFTGRPWPTRSAPAHQDTEHVTMPPPLRLMRLRFSLQAAARTNLPPHKGELLYRTLLWLLRAIWCRQPGSCRDGSQFPATCLFDYMIEPHVDPTWPPPIRRWIGATPPPACVVWDEQDRRTQVTAGDLLHFELALIGELAIRQYPAFVAAMMVASERGIGRERLRARLAQVDVLTGPDGQATPMLINGTWQGIPDGSATLGYADGLAWAEQVAPAGPVTRFGLRFLSPIQLETQGKVIREPHFRPLMQAIVRRLRILGQVHGERDWSRSEYEPLLNLTDHVRLERDETMWLNTIYHDPPNAGVSLQGFVGQAWYASPADLRPLLPMLWLGQWVHVGKGTAWGNGRYAVEMNQQGGAANGQ